MAKQLPPAGGDDTTARNLRICGDERGLSGAGPTALVFSACPRERRVSALFSSRELRPQLP
jgi:hypothetical protein